jgi:glutaredoxin
MSGVGPTEPPKVGGAGSAGAGAVKLHRCSNVWVKVNGHPCWRVQKALDDAGVEYEVVTGPYRKSKRDDLERLSGQRLYPVIEFEDGSVYHEESKEMAAKIEAGQLDQQRQTAADAPS